MENTFLGKPLKVDPPSPGFGAAGSWNLEIKVRPREIGRWMAGTEFAKVPFASRRQRRGIFHPPEGS
jgi:hypothetical protein